MTVRSGRPATNPSGSLRAASSAAKERGDLTWGDGERLFDRLYFLRGFENLMADIATACCLT